MTPEIPNSAKMLMSHGFYHWFCLRSVAASIADSKFNSIIAIAIIVSMASSSGRNATTKAFNVTKSWSFRG